MLTLEVIIFVAIVIVQFLLGIVSISTSSRLEGKYAYPLGSRATVADLLEKYTRIYDQVNLKVNAVIKLPVLAEMDLLLVSRKTVYRSDLYSNFFAVYQMLLTKLENRQIQKFEERQVLGFVIELLVFALGFVTGISIIVWIAFLFGVVLVLSGFWFERSVNMVMEEAVEIARDLLELDDVEVGRAMNLGKDIGIHMHKYPFLPVMRAFQFISPL